MSPRRCQFCNAIRMTSQAETSEHRLEGPWPATYQFRKVTCPQCRRPTHQQVASFTDGTFTHWDGWSEVMVEGHDYDVLSRFGGRRLDGVRHVIAAWAWTPMGNHWDARIRDSILKDEVFRGELASVLILPPGVRTVEWVHWATLHFSECWQLRPPIMQGGVGPYAGLRAARSIQSTLMTMGLRGIRHYWPDPILRAADYRAVSDASHIQREWSSYSRSHLTIKVKEPA